MKKEIAERPTPETTMESLSVEAVGQQIAMIQTLISKHLKENEHYGIIPGTKKNTLYKSGAEKLGLLFRLAPKFFVEETDLGNGHRAFRVRCELQHIKTGAFWGEGVGMASTMESKYRYRRGEPVSTGRVVPKAYWETRDASLLGGKGFVPSKINGQWFICTAGDKTENPDIADTYNTVLKMAKKRAHVDGIISATAASDIFTQDMEENTTQAAETTSPATAQKLATEIVEALGRAHNGNLEAMAKELEQATIHRADGNDQWVELDQLGKIAQEKPDWLPRIHEKVMAALAAKK